MVKGLVIGGAIGYGAYALGLDGGWNWLTYGVVGAFVGLLVGKPLWSLIMDKNSTTVVGALKAIFGFGVCVGLYALVAKAWGGFQVSIAGETRWVWAWQPIMGAAVGAVYGGFVELDDSLDDNAARKKATEQKQLAAAAKKKP
jgi:Na+/proline symporter